jgi:hypothetical protein
MPNMQGIHHPKFGPADKPVPPNVVPRVVSAGLRPCPRCSSGIRVRDHYCRSCGFDVSTLPPPPPEGRSVGVWTVPGPEGVVPYRPLSGHTTALRGVLALLGCSAVAMTLLSLTVARALGTWLPWPRLHHPEWSELQTWGGLLAIVQLTLIAMVTLLVVLWTRRAYRNLPALHVTGCRFAPRWATLGWLIPGVNLVVPKLVLDDTWRASEPKARPWTTSWRQAPVPAALHLWMICSLAALPVVVLVQIQLSMMGSLPPSPKMVSSTETLYLVLALAEVLLVGCCVLLWRVVGMITERQRERAYVLGPAAPLRTEDEPASPGPVEHVVPVPLLLVPKADLERIGRY